VTEKELEIRALHISQGLYPVVRDMFAYGMGACTVDENGRVQHIPIQDLNLLEGSEPK